MEHAMVAFYLFVLYIAIGVAAWAYVEDNDQLAYSWFRDWPRGQFLLLVLWPLALFLQWRFK